MHEEFSANVICCLFVVFFFCLFRPPPRLNHAHSGIASHAGVFTGANSGMV